MQLAALELAGLVGLAGALGALARYPLGRLVAEKTTSAFPFGTWLINVTGAFVIGVLFALTTKKLLSVQMQTVLATGFLGGYTTFSTFALGDVLLLSKGAWAGAALYLVVSIFGGLLAVIIGDRLGHLIIARFKRTTGKLASLKRSSPAETHLDIQDDLLFSDHLDTPQSKRS